MFFTKIKVEGSMEIIAAFIILYILKIPGKKHGELKFL